MVVRPALVLAAVGLVSCAFEPRGPATGDDDGALAVDAATDDGASADPDATTIDGATIDAPTIDAATIDAAVPIDGPVATCPTGYTVVAGASQFRFVTGLQPVTNAGADCGNDGTGTHLATFEDAGDVATVLANRSGNEEFWVGAACGPGPQVDCGQPAGWRWRAGNTAVAPGLWADGEPNNGATEHNAVLFKQMGDWRLNNVVGIESHAYICECGN